MASKLMSCGVTAICSSVFSSSKSKFATAVPLPVASNVTSSSRITMSAQPRLPYSAPG
nr:chlorophyll A-B binding protein 6A, chloroplastic [Ipomoea batatas]